MKLKSLLVCAAAWLALGAMPALATPASDASIEKLLEVRHVESTVNDLNASFEQEVRKGFTKTIGKLTPERQGAYDQFIAKATALMREEYDWSKIKQEFIQIYRGVFTQEEIEGLITFYRTPVGQSMLQKMPQLEQKTAELFQRHQIALIPKYLATMRDGR
jgi:hypothetical protein